MILITSFGEFLLYFIVIFFSLHKKKKVAVGIYFLFGVVLGCPVLATGEHVPVD